MDVGMSGLDFVELQRRHVTPDTERSVDRKTSVVVAQIWREVQNPDRKNVIQFYSRHVILS